MEKLRQEFQKWQISTAPFLEVSLLAKVVMNFYASIVIKNTPTYQVKNLALFVFSDLVLVFYC